MATLKTKNTEIYYEIKGSGPYLVLLAGLASDSQSWSTVTNKLARHFTLIMPDNRGTGRTKCQAEEIHIAGMAKDVIAVMDHLSIGTAHVAGHSMGGYVAQRISLEYPQRISKLVLADTSAFTCKRNQALLCDLAKYPDDGMDLREWFRCLYYWIFTHRFFENEKILELSLDYSVNYPYPQSPEQFRKQVEALNHFNVADRLKEIRHQTLILCGREDILFYPEESIRVLSAIPESKISVIENTAHAIHVEQPDAFTAELLDFLSGEQSR